jgi:hypothetical protein
MIFPHTMIMEPTVEATGYVLMCLLSPLKVSRFYINICDRKAFLNKGFLISAKFKCYELQFSLII